MASIGAQFLPERFAECVDSVKAAEDAGYSHAWFVDSQILWQDCYVYMSHALAATERIVIGTAVTNPFTRHVTTTASVYGTLAELHPGRLELGIGRGDSSVRTMGMNPVKTTFLRDSIVLRHGRPIPSSRAASTPSSGEDDLMLHVRQPAVARRSPGVYL